MTQRIVHCAKLGADLPGLDVPPFAGSLGQRIFEHVSKQAYNLWPQEATILMNHYGLSMAEPEHRRFLMEQMEVFFFGGGAPPPSEAVDKTPR